MSDLERSGNTFKEVLAQLVLVAVFKTVGSHGNHVIGGFDSHAFPPFFHLAVPQIETSIAWLWSLAGSRRTGLAGALGFYQRDDD